MTKRTRIRALRARRFALRAPVRYRADAGAWHSGTTESISRSGLLLRVEEPLEPDTAIEMVVELPAVAGEEAARVVCNGRIVRAAATPTHGPIVAATISRYRFDRESSA